MKKHWEDSEPSTKCEIEFYRHMGVFLSQSQNATRIENGRNEPNRVTKVFLTMTWAE